MRRVFADTSYWVAIFSPRDALHNLAVHRSKEMTDCILVTSEMVLTEFGNFFCGSGDYFRRGAGQFIQEIQNDPNIEVEPQTTLLFQRALAEYNRYTDKTWSLTDCSSIVIMRKRALQEVLTNDHHFEQASFTILLC
jgi:uncharacterized protein